MNKFNFKIEIIGSKLILLNRHNPNATGATFLGFGYKQRHYIEEKLCPAMAYAEKCASELKTKYLYDDNSYYDCSYDENEDVINPYMVRIKDIIHNNIVVGGEVKSNQVDWIIPDIDEDIELVNQKYKRMFRDSEDEVKTDNHDDFLFEKRAELLLLRCSDYWEYASCKNVA